MGIEQMVGRTMVSVQNVGDEELVFTDQQGNTFRFFHQQDCCESVSIEDICGELDDLVGSPLVLAEDRTPVDDDDALKAKDEYDDSFTWTFYEFATVKGSVTVRWYGSSNGYYGEGVDLSVNGHDFWLGGEPNLQGDAR